MAAVWPLAAIGPLTTRRRTHLNAPMGRRARKLRYRVHPQVFIDGVAIPLDKTPRVLGVHLDTHFTFGGLAQAIAKGCRSKLRILSSLAGTGWGCQKETLLKTYKTYVEPSINYAAAIWSPNASDSSFEVL